MVRRAERMTDRIEPTPAIPAEPAAVRPGPLEYGVLPPLRRRRWFRRLVFTVLLVSALAGAGARWGRAAYERAVELYRQRRGENYSPPPDQLVFDCDPVRAAKLANDRNYEILQRCACRREPEGFQEGGALAAHALVFLHERHAAGRPPRIVLVEYVPREGAAVIVLIVPARINRPAKVLPLSLQRLGPQSFLADVRFYAGQPDPADASRFTIRYECDGVTHRVDGFLNADDTVTMTERGQK